MEHLNRFCKSSLAGHISCVFCVYGVFCALPLKCVCVCGTGKGVMGKCCCSDRV